MKVLWTHNFDPRVLNSGCFMYTAAQGLSDVGVRVDLRYLGVLRRPDAILRAQRELAVASKSYDLVHAQYGSACAFATAGSRVPYLVSVRGSDWNRYPKLLHRYWLHTRLARMLTRVAIRKCSGVIAVSRRIAREIQAELRYAKVVVIPSPIDLDRWPLVSASDRLGRQKFRVMFASNSENNALKRGALVSAAVRRAADGFANIELVRATGIPHHSMPNLVSSCDAVVCASYMEGWPNSVKEALACGLPFVSTDVSDLAEIAAREPSCRIVRPEIEDIADGLRHALQCGPSPELRRHVSHLSLENSTRALVAACAEALG